MEGLNQVKRVLRKKWVKIAALAVAATLVVTIGLAFFANTYRIVSPAEEILQGVSVEDGLLTVNLETPFLLSPMTTFVPCTTQATGGGEPSCSSSPPTHPATGSAAGFTGQPANTPALRAAIPGS